MTEAATALARGDAFVDLSAWWKVGVKGSDAHAWLNDLLSAELEGLRPGASRRSFLLTPTGRIRAAVTITPRQDGYLLVQDPEQPARIDSLLERYVLSSDVLLDDLTHELRLIALPGVEEVDRGVASYSPSAIGPGMDLLVETGSTPALEGLVEASGEEVERWRVRRGIARFGVDLTTDSLPHEVDTGDTIAFGKGCFLGQEAVAKVRNLGHPPFVLLAANAVGDVSAGDEVLADGQDAGRVTSVAEEPSGGTALIARVRWAVKDSALVTGSGSGLTVSGLASAA